MTATRSERANFYWYCAAAAQLIEQMPANAATSSCSRHALRNATNAITGRKGVSYASVAAKRAMRKNGGVWTGCGLVKEHAIPVGHIHELVTAAVRKRRSERAMATAQRRLDRDMAESGLDARLFDAFPRNPRIWFVVEIVRASTAMAWLTAKEDGRIRAAQVGGSARLVQRMPQDWDGKDPFARYRACGIEVQPT